MTTLRKLQENMQAFVLENNDVVIRDIKDFGDIAVSDRLSVYRNAYYLRLIEVLEGDYSALTKIMGKEAFSRMICDYLNNFPSHCFSVNKVGKNLTKFIKSCSDLCGDSCELATFEWRLNESLSAEDALTLTTEKLSQVPPEKWVDLQFYFHPSVDLLLCYYNTLERWCSLHHDDQDIQSVKLPNPQYCLIWRFNNEVYHEMLSREGFSLLDCIRQGKKFSELCEMLLSYFDDETKVVNWVSGTLQSWISRGVFADLCS